MDKTLHELLTEAKELRLELAESLAKLSFVHQELTYNILKIDREYDAFKNSTNVIQLKSDITKE